MKAFNLIPGPRGFLGLGTLLEYTALGKYDWNSLHKNGFKKYEKYGPIVKETILPGVNVLWLFDPEDIASVLNDFTKKDFPFRRSHSAMVKYRLERPEIYNNSGLLPTNGPEWWRIRSELQKNLSKPTYVRNFIGATNDIIDDMVSKLRRDCSAGDLIHILPYLDRLSLELIIYLTFGIRFNSLSPDSFERDSTASKLIDAANLANGNTLVLDQKLPFWKVIPTKTYSDFERSIMYLEQWGIKLLQQCLTDLDNGPSSTCLVRDYMGNPNLDKRDLMGMTVDYLLAGVDTTSHTTSFILYHICKNPVVQEQLFKEVEQVLDLDGQLSSETLNSKLPFCRAVLKESMRLNPISVGVGRLTTKASAIRGYNVPANTVIVTQNFVSCRLPEYFHNPLQFLPERWLKTNPNKADVHPYLVLPFGHGMRACIARRFAEQNMLMTIAKIVRNFELKWGGVEGDLDIETKLINKPKDPVNIVFTPRSA